MVNDRSAVDDHGPAVPSGTIMPSVTVCVPSGAIGTVRTVGRVVPPRTHPGIPPDAESPVERSPVRSVRINIGAPPGVVPGIAPGTEIDGESIDRAVEFVEPCLIALTIGIFCDKIEIPLVILCEEFFFFLLFLLRNHCADHPGPRIGSGAVVDIVAISC